MLFLFVYFLFAGNITLVLAKTCCGDEFCFGEETCKQKGENIRETIFHQMHLFYQQLAEQGAIFKEKNMRVNIH